MARAGRRLRVCSARFILSPNERPKKLESVMIDPAKLETELHDRESTCLSGYEDRVRLCEVRQFSRIADTLERLETLAKEKS
jgi:hypothetical protein